jgi:hypothetical protein
VYDDEIDHDGHDNDAEIYYLCGYHDDGGVADGDTVNMCNYTNTYFELINEYVEFLSL